MSASIPATLPSPVRRAWAGLAPRLEPYLPRWQSRQFWAVQVLVLLIALGHMAFESLSYAPDGSSRSLELSFVPTAFFFIPAIYAALNFGTVGAVATAAWCVLISLPNVALFHNDQDWLADLVQLTAVSGTTFFVGQRTDREIAARRRAEDAARALKSSELKYRNLFEASPPPILILDPTGLILEANPAAGALFDLPRNALRGRPIGDLVGRAGARAILNAPAGGALPVDDLVVKPRGGPERYLQPLAARLDGGDGRPAIQLLLRDLTEERLRQSGLRAYAANILRAQEAERTRIARDLHDQTVQELVLLCRQLDLAEAAGAVAPAVVDELGQARRTAEKVVGDLRDFARSLRPPTLDDLGLATAIRGLLADLMERTRIDGDLAVVGAERRLEGDVELAIFRIAQEALHNVERHAGASHVRVTLRFGERDLELRIEDDGVGFASPPSADFAASGHLGLLGMRERAETIGGRLDIVSRPGQGARVVVHVGTSVDATGSAYFPASEISPLNDNDA